MKFKPGQKIKMKEDCLAFIDSPKKGQVGVLEYGDKEGCLTDFLFAHFIKGRECSHQDKWLPLTNRGKNPRGKDGKFIKMSHGKAVQMSSTLSGQRELLRNHENRIKELETFIDRIVKTVNDLQG